MAAYNVLKGAADLLAAIPATVVWPNQTVPTSGDYYQLSIVNADSLNSYTDDLGSNIRLQVVAWTYRKGIKEALTNHEAAITALQNAYVRVLGPLQNLEGEWLGIISQWEAIG